MESRQVSASGNDRRDRGFQTGWDVKEYEVGMNVWMLSLVGFVVGGLIAYALYKNIKGNW